MLLGCFALLVPPTISSLQGIDVESQPGRVRYLSLSYLGRVSHMMAKVLQGINIESQSCRTRYFCLPYLRRVSNRIAKVLQEEFDSVKIS